jgi:hypothetical protein
MARAEEYRHLVTRARERTSREASPVLVAEWRNLAGRCVRLARSQQNDPPTLIATPSVGRGLESV